MTATALARRHGCSSLGAVAHASLTAGAAYKPTAAAAAPQADAVPAHEENGLAPGAGAQDCDSGVRATRCAPGVPFGEAAVPTASVGNLQVLQTADVAASNNCNVARSIMPGLQQWGGTALHSLAAPQPPSVTWLSPWHSIRLSMNPQPPHLLPSALIAESGVVNAFKPSRASGCYPPPSLPALAGALGPTPSAVAVASASAAAAAAAVTAAALQRQALWLRRALSTAGPPTSGTVMRALEAPTSLAKLQVGGPGGPHRGWDCKLGSASAQYLPHMPRRHQSTTTNPSCPCCACCTSGDGARVAAPHGPHPLCPGRTDCWQGAAAGAGGGAEAHGARGGRQGAGEAGA